MNHFMWETHHSRRKTGHQFAQGMVEFALVMPILLMAVYGLFEVGRMIFIYSNVVTAAREAVRYGSATGNVNGDLQYKDCAGIRKAAQNVDFLGSIEDANIVIDYYDNSGASLFTINTPTCPAASAIPDVARGGLIKVTVSGSFYPLAAIVQLSPKLFSSWGERTILGRVDVTGSGGGGGTPPPDTGGVQPPVISKAFLPVSIVLGEKATLLITLTNPNDSTDLTNIGFTDNYPSGLMNVNPLVTTNNCGGSVSASAGGSSLDLSGGSLSPYGQCTITTVVTTNGTGTFTNTSGQVTATESVAGNTASAILAVTPPGFICNNNKIVHGSLFFDVNTMETMTLNNNTGQDLTISSIDVTWNHDNGHKKGLKLIGIQVASQTVNINSGNSGPEYVFTPSPGWTLPPGRSTFQFTFDKSYDTQDGTELVIMNFSNPGCDAFTFRSDVNSPPVIEKFFSPPTINANGTSLLTFIITNPNNAVIGLTGISFVDRFPTGMTRAAIPASLQCQGRVTSTSTSITLTGGVIPAETSCTVQVLVTAVAGIWDNTTDAVLSTNAGTGNVAKATLTASVLPPNLAWKRFSPSVIQVHGTSTLSLRIVNPNVTTALTGLTFTDTFPDGMTLASTPNSAQCGGTVTSTDGSITLTNGTLAGATNCTVSASVTVAVVGSYTNTSGAVSSTEGGASNTATSTLTVGPIQPPAISKAFFPTTVQVGTPSTLSLTINNPNSQTTLNGISFSDTYPDGLVNADPLVSANTCGGSVSAVAGGNSISLSDATLLKTASCSVSIKVISTAIGTYTNMSGEVSSTEGGTGNNSSATLKVLAVMPPKISKAFAPATIQIGQSSTLTFTLENPNGSSDLTGVAFSDPYPAGMTNVNPPVTANTCGGSLTAAGDANSLTLSGGVIPADGSCSISVSVTAATINNYDNTSSSVTSANGGTGNAATASLNISAIQPPVFTSMSYSPNQILTGAASTLSFTIRNPNGSTTLNDIAFTDTYPANMLNASPLLINNTCGGLVAATANGTTLGLSGVTLAAGVSCNLSIQVTASSAGNYSNSTGSISSSNGGTGSTASASLLVTTAPCNGTTVTHGSIQYPSATTMRMMITNNAGQPLTLNQVKVWWNQPYGHYTNNGHSRDPLNLEQVQLGNLMLYGPGNVASSPLSISGSGNVLPTGSIYLTITFVATYDNHENDALSMNFTNPECNGFTLTAP